MLELLILMLAFGVNVSIEINDCTEILFSNAKKLVGMSVKG